MKFYSLTILVFVAGLSLLLIPAAWGVNHFFDSPEWRKQQGIIMDLYPDDLVLTLEGGKLTTNQSGPVVIPFPAEWREEHDRNCRDGKRCDDDPLPANLLVIDRNATVSSRAFTERDTIVLASENEIGFHNPNRGETRIMALAEAKWDRKIELTSATFDYWVGRVASIVETGILLMFSVLPLVMYLAIWLGYLLYSLLGALVVWLAAHIRGHRLTYAKAYFSTLYLLPLPFVLNLIMSGGQHRIPLVFSLALFGMALLNFQKPTSPAPIAPLPQPVNNTQPTSGTPPRPASA